MVSSFRDGSGGACGVDDRSILTFSQSENPNSSHFADQTRMFSNKEWVNPPFCEFEVLAEPGLVTERVCDAPPCAPAADPAPVTQPGTTKKCTKKKGKKKKKRKGKRCKKKKKKKKRG
jgi:hypothetical protein